MNFNSRTRVALQFAANLVILIGAHLIAVQIRLRIPWGLPLGPEYDAQPFGFYPVAAGALALTYALAWLVSRSALGRRFLAPKRQFRVLLVGLALTLLGTLLFLPDLSQLQLIYFVVTVLILGLCVIVWPGRINPKGSGQDFFANIARLVTSRSLLGLWLRYNIQSRYSQTLLGIFWIVLLPLATAGVLALAFGQIIRVDYGVPFISFFLAGLVPWGVFNQGMGNGVQSLISRMALINQVNFPREVLVLLALGEALIDLSFTFLIMVVINMLNGIYPNVQWIFLPVLLAILVCFTLGMMFFVSSLSVMVRDIPQLISVVLQLLFYISPILYPVSNIPDRFRFVVLLNPIALVIEALRDILIYARTPDPLTLYYPLVVSLALLYMGYAFFKANEDRIADFQ